MEYENYVIVTGMKLEDFVWRFERVSNLPSEAYVEVSPSGDVILRF